MQTDRLERRGGGHEAWARGGSWTSSFREAGELGGGRALGLARRVTAGQCRPRASASGRREDSNGTGRRLHAHYTEQRHWDTRGSHAQGRSGAHGSFDLSISHMAKQWPLPSPPERQTPGRGHQLANRRAGRPAPRALPPPPPLQACCWATATPSGRACPPGAQSHEGKADAHARHAGTSPPSCGEGGRKRMMLSQGAGVRGDAQHMRAT